MAVERSTPTSRRTFLYATGLGLTAGCLESPGGNGEATDPTGSAAFFSLMDWANAVGGEVITFDTPVEVGRAGHGWDPPADLLPQVADRDVFVYLDSPDFRWAVDLADTIEHEQHDVALIDVLAAIPREALLPFVDHEHETGDHHHHGGEWSDREISVGRLEVQHGAEIVASWDGTDWAGELPEIPRAGGITLEFRMVEEGGEELPLGQDAPFRIETVVLDEESTADVAAEDRGGSTLLTASTRGEARIAFELIRDEEVIHDTTQAPLTIGVGPPAEGTVDGFFDPHVWIDPLHAQRIVAHLAARLSESYPDHADGFRDRADTYADEVAAVHEAFLTVSETAELDIAVGVTHDSFRYLAERYGFELRTPVGIAPDAAASLEDLAGLAHTIEDHEIDTILYDPFEAPEFGELPQACQLLLEETPADEAAPISSIEGLTPEWRDAGFGWIEQMREVNLPAFRAALRAET